MAKKDELKDKFNDLTISLVDIVDTIDDTKTKKYLEFFCKIIREYISTKSSSESQNIKEKTLHGLVELISKMLLTKDNKKVIDTLSKFKDYNEKGLLSVNDIQKYNNIDQISDAVKVADERKRKEELESKVVKFHEDNEWLIVQPLSYESSLKYGKSTQWCTTTNKTHFDRYTNSEQFLFYIINKKTDVKVAVQSSGSRDNVDFWDNKDKKNNLFYYIKHKILPTGIIDKVMSTIEEIKPLKYKNHSSNKSEKNSFIDLSGSLYDAINGTTLVTSSGLNNLLNDLRNGNIIETDEYGDYHGYDDYYSVSNNYYEPQPDEYTRRRKRTDGLFD